MRSLRSFASLRMTGWLALAFALPVAAQRYGGQVTVNVVEVPVHVERFGRPIAGLTKDDFELFVNGEPQTIEDFEVIDDRLSVATPAAAADPPPLDRRRLTVLLFDLGTVSDRHNLARAQRAATQVVASAPARDTFAVARVGHGGIRFLVPFASDRAAITHAIATLNGSDARDPFGLAMLDGERSAAVRSIVGGADTRESTFQELWGGSGGISLAGSRSATAAAAAAEAAARFEEDQQITQAIWFSDLLSGLADRLAPLSGMKRVVLLSGRGGDGLRYPASRSTVLQNAMRMHKRFRAAGVILDCVDTNAASAAPWGVTVTMPYFGPSDFLYTLALDTGGAVGQSLKDIEHRNSITYLLVFQPRGPQKKTNTIRVRLKNRPLLTDVRYRRSYSLDAPNDDADGLVLADTLTNDIPRNGVTVDVHVAPKQQAMQVEVSLPGKELLALDAKLIDVFFYVFDERKLVADWNHVRVALDLEKGRDYLIANPFRVRKSFTLGPGRYAAKALVRVVGSEAAGFRRADFIVPSP